MKNLQRATTGLCIQLWISSTVKQAMKKGLLHFTAEARRNLQNIMIPPLNRNTHRLLRSSGLGAVNITDWFYACVVCFIVSKLFRIMFRREQRGWICWRSAPRIAIDIAEYYKQQLVMRMGIVGGQTMQQMMLNIFWTSWKPMVLGNK